MLIISKYVEKTISEYTVFYVFVMKAICTYVMHISKVKFAAFSYDHVFNF